MRKVTVWAGLLFLLVAFDVSAEEQAVEGDKSAKDATTTKGEKAADGCKCDQPSDPDKGHFYMIDTKGFTVLGGWFGPEVTFGTMGFDGAGSFTAGITGGIELFSRVGIGLDIGYVSSLGDKALDGWTTNDSLAGFYVGGLIGVVFIHHKFFSWGLDAKLDFATLCRVNDSGDANDTGGSCDESTNGFIIDPRFTFLFRVTRSFRFKLLAGYRWGTFDDTWTGPNKGDFGGIYAGLGIDLGKF